MISPILGFRLDKRLKDKLEQICEETGFSKSQILTDKVKEVIRDYEKNKKDLIETHLYR